MKTCRVGQKIEFTTPKGRKLVGIIKLETDIEWLVGCDHPKMTFLVDKSAKIAYSPSINKKSLYGLDGIGSMR